VIASTDKDAGYLRRWGMAPVHKTRVIAPGIDIDRWPGHESRRDEPRCRWLPYLSPDAFVLGTAARLCSGKGLEQLIHAIGRLQSSEVNIQLLIAGVGGMRRELERLVQQLGLEHDVHFVGFQREMRAFYNALDAFALCSRTESFGLSLTEAMACGLPVMATPTHGAMRQIHHERNGILASGFSVESIADAILTLHRNRTLCSRLGRTAFEHVRRHCSIDNTLDLTFNAIAPGHARPTKPSPHAPPPVVMEASA
jgi:glycosyltransferase involved in cell wall biosynthesis